LKFDADPKKPSTKVMQAGNMFQVNAAPGKGHTEISAKGEVSIPDLIYLLATQLCIPVFAATGALANTATFAPLSQSANAKKALTLEKGLPGSGNAKQTPDVSCVDLELDFAYDKPVMVSAKMMGRNRLADQTLTATPTTLAGAVLWGTRIDVYLATSEAGLSGGLLYPLSTKCKLSKFLGDVYTLGSANPSFEAMVDVAPSPDVELVLPNDTAADAFVDSIDSATQYYIEIIARGALIEGSLYNQLRIRTPIFFADPGEGSSQDIHTVTIKGNISHTEDFNTTGGALLIECQSTLAGL